MKITRYWVKFDKSFIADFASVEEAVSFVQKFYSSWAEDLTIGVSGD